jgi:hypothetical protein
VGRPDRRISVGGGAGGSSVPHTQRFTRKRKRLLNLNVPVSSVEVPVADEAEFAAAQGSHPYRERLKEARNIITEGEPDVEG